MDNYLLKNKWMILQLTISSNINYHPRTNLGSKPSHWSFPGGLLVMSSSADTGDTGSIPPTMHGVCATTEPLSRNYRSLHAPGPMLQNERSPHSEKSAHHTKEQPGPGSTTGEEPMQQRRPSTAPNQSILKNKKPRVISSPTSLALVLKS